jgi:hypothetical protein
VPQKSFSGPTHRRFQELEQGTVEFVHLKSKTDVLVTHVAIRYKAQELVKSHSITRLISRPTRNDVCVWAHVCACDAGKLVLSL